MPTCTAGYLLKLKGQAFPVNPGSLPHTDATQDGFHRVRFLWFPEFLKTTEVFISFNIINKGSYQCKPFYALFPDP